MIKDAGRDVEAQVSTPGNISSDLNNERLDEAYADRRDDSQLKTDPDVQIVDWDGPDDPENPFNWPKKKKWLITAVALFGYVSCRSMTSANG